MAKNLFRKVALERLASPEQLDQMIKVTKSTGWLTLFAIGLLITVGLLWGIFGRIPTTVNGQGILILRGGILSIASNVNGRVSAVTVEKDDVVVKGQTVAIVEQPKLLQQINDVKGQITQLYDKLSRLEELGSRNSELQKDARALQRKTIKQSKEYAKQRQKVLTKRYEQQQILLDQGLIMKSTLLDTKQQINENEQQVKDYDNQLKQLNIDEFQLYEQLDQKIADVSHEIRQQNRKIRELEADYNDQSRIISPYSGIVIELSIKEGRLVSEGTSIMNVEVTEGESRNLEAVLYLPSTEGKKVHNRMLVQVAPSTVKQEEHGFILGMVTMVSPFPASSQHMMVVLENETLVSSLSKKGAPLEIYAELIPDPDTKSGYKWSSAEGPPISIQSGTICTATVIVDEQPPISLVIPWLKKNILGVGQEAK